MSNPFAILADYPKEGPAAPEREKVHRQKDHHESGTGRRDRTKREGRGPANWGNPRDDTRVNKKADRIDAITEQDQLPVEDSTPKINYVPASQFFDDSDDEDVAGQPVVGKAQKAIDPQFLAIMTEKAKKQVVAKEQSDEDEDNQLDTNFLSTEQALRQRQNQQRSRPPRGGRGGRGPRRDGERPPRRDDDRPPRRDGNGPARKFGDRPREGQKPEGQKNERQPRHNDRKPRDQRNSGVQHQRVNGGRTFTSSDFPSL